MCAGTFCGSSCFGRGMSGCASVGRQPSSRSSLRRPLDPLLDVANALEVLAQLVAVVRADARPEALRLLPHRVEDAAVERPAGPVADQAIERPRGIDLLGGRLRGRDPRQARPVDHREPVLEPQLVGLDAEHEARDSRLVRREPWPAPGPSTCRHGSRSGSRLTGAPDSRFMRPRCGLVETCADWLKRPLMNTMSSRCGSIGCRPGPSSIVSAAALRPPVRRLDAVREVDDAQADRGLRRGCCCPLPAARKRAATPSTEGSARRRCLAERGAATWWKGNASCSWTLLLPAAAAGFGCASGVGAASTLLRAMAELTARHEPRGQIRERRVATKARSSRGSAVDRTPCGLRPSA